TKFSERVVDRAILPELHGLVQRAAAGIGHAYAEGGDEMIVHLPNATVAIGVAFAEALRRLIGGHRFQVDAEIVTLTVSLGVAASNSLPGETLADLANNAKQHAKTSGKNCVAVLGPSGPVIMNDNFVTSA